MSQQAFQLTQPDRPSGAEGFDPTSRSADTAARLSEIRALSRARGSATHLLPLWLESACLGAVLSLILASFALLNLDLGTRGNLVATLSISAVSVATIAAGLSRVRRPSALGFILLSLAALLLTWFAFATTGDSLEVQPTRRSFELTPS